MTSIIFRGLYITADVELTPATPPSYGSGGDPAYAEVGQTEISLASADDFLATDILSALSEQEGWSDAETDAYDEAIQRTGTLSPIVEDYAVSMWESEIEECLIEHS